MRSLATLATIGLFVMASISPATAMSGGVHDCFPKGCYER